MTNTTANRIKALEDRCHSYVSQINHLEFQNLHLEAELNRLHAQLSYQRGLRVQAGSLYKELDSRILATLHRRSRKLNQKRKVASKIEIDTLSNASLRELLHKARSYDARSFFRYSTQPNTTKLSYRIAEGTYKTTRDVGKISAKKAYRLLRRGKNV